jgi:hypothetical protein
MRHFLRTAGVRCVILACALGLLLQPPCAAQERNPQLVMETSLGKVRLELFAGTRFHRNGGSTLLIVDKGIL